MGNQIFRQDVTNLAELAKAIKAVSDMGIDLDRVTTMNSPVIDGYDEPTISLTVESHFDAMLNTCYTAVLS